MSVQIVRQTFDERVEMYMKHSKEELARMLAQQALYMFPEGCKECENDYAQNAECVSTTNNNDYIYIIKD